MKQQHNNNKEKEDQEQLFHIWHDDDSQESPFDLDQVHCQKPESEDTSGDYEENCIFSCPTIEDFLDLTDEMIETIISLEDELVRWRQALIKYLPKDWAEGLRQDIFNNLSRDFNGDPAYDLYVELKRGDDPQISRERGERLYRLSEGTDETSITYL